MPRLVGINHVALEVGDLEAALEWYGRIFEFEIVREPPFPHMAFLQMGDQFIALAAGRTQLADNLARAAELATVPSETILELYTALRPHRSTAEELEAWAERLETELAAPLSAAFVRDALAAYAARGLLDTGDRAPV